MENTLSPCGQYIKRLSIFICCAIMVFQGIAQTATNNSIDFCTQWNELEYTHNFGTGETSTKTRIFVAEGDTVINETTYKKILNYYWSSTPTDKEYIGAMRWQGDKVFLHYNQTEYLLYDFGVKVGDELDIFAGLNNAEIMGTYKNKVTDVTILPNGKRKITVDVYPRFNEDDDQTDIDSYIEKGVEWIEGVGSTQGLLYTGIRLPGCYGYRLLCASQGDELIYQTKDEWFTQFGCGTEINTDFCTQWNELEYSVDCFMSWELYNTKTRIYVAEGDTMINGTDYTKLLAYYCAPTLTDKEYIGAIRQQGSKVFLHYNQTEYLLYDFGVKVGDELEVFAGINNVESVGTFKNKVIEITMLPNGRQKITLELYRLNDGTTDIVRSGTTEWIEGVGCKQGLLYTGAMPAGCHGYTILCASRGDELVYQTDDEPFAPFGCGTDNADFTTWIYFTDKDGIRDSLLVGMDPEATFGVDEKWETVMTTQDIDKWKEKTFWACFKFDGNQEEPYYTRSNIVPPLARCEIIGKGAFTIIFPADRLPVTISWNKEAFAAPDREYSTLSDLLQWFDVTADNNDNVEITMSKEDHVTLYYFNEDLIRNQYDDIIEKRMMRRIDMAFGDKSNKIDAYISGISDCYNPIEDALEDIQTISPLVSPNPAQTYINLQLPAVSQVAVYSATGSCIMQSADTRISIAHLPAGIYLLRATDTAGKQYQAKFVKE